MTERREQKKQYRRLQARKKGLPEGQRAAMEAVERYAVRSGGVGSAEDVIALMAALVDVFERSVGDGTPVAAVVGEDPAAFAETFLTRDSASGWVRSEQRRLGDAVTRAAVAPSVLVEVSR